MALGSQRHRNSLRQRSAQAERGLGLHPHEQCRGADRREVSERRRAQFKGPGLSADTREGKMGAPALTKSPLAAVYTVNMCEQIKAT